MLLVWMLLAFAQGATSTTPVTEVAWYSAPNYRGTWDLIVSCVLTLVICVWSALHLNVPVETSRLRERNSRRLRWVLLGIFAPEVVVSTAFAQFLTARWLRNEIRADIEDRNKDKGTRSSMSEKERVSEGWSMSQCYFAVMGGIVIETGDYIAAPSPLSITAEGARLLSFLNKLPQIKESEVRDKSKADGLAKILVVLQAGWMIIQCIARVAQDLPVTLLEINTIGHVICAFALYILWWSKPLGIKDPYKIVGEHGLDKHIALMYMCSPISADREDEISEIRCLAYVAPDDRSPTTTTAKPDSRIQEIPVPKSHSTRFSVGSIGARDPLKFIGPLQKIQVGVDANHDVQYMYKCERIAPEHEEFFRLQDRNHCLQHTRDYCRRGFKDCKDRSKLSGQAKRRWTLANDIVQELWDECDKRKDYMKVFFTHSTLGIFVGEPIYIADHIPNFPGFSFLGSVNVQRDILKTVVAFAGAAYGGLHLAAWNDYFPTAVERIIWISCSCATGLTGLVLALFFLATNQLPQLENVESHVRNSRTFRFFLKRVLIPLFMTARVFIVVEAFVCLRRQPEAIYKTPEWSNYFPHL
ncbi:hypothetical protein BU25DRAFT_50081 [Macroventuria anomochaeta]|uniref:Uncharacterized protein n=1 Tax=Macroventuria anomochaeta TaxID=301207 RepID=A0ACB6S0J8_9PLEO|nr:uncharacterized protein BU25DRAFT_50081 [Macroventuria anomochaeta]KAF2627558.1 hypothetical protein BU25DRAFT_50081 [Macroventuria anomochaeta]